MPVAMTKEQALESIHALARVDKNNVGGLKPSYSNDGTRIYTGSSGRVARSLGALGAGYLGSYNQDHKNLLKAVERVCQSIDWLPMSASDLSALAVLVAKAAAGVLLLYDTHYEGKERKEHFSKPYEILKLTAEHLDDVAYVKAAEHGNINK